LISKVAAAVHDRDKKTRKILRRLWPGKQELLDCERVVKFFNRN
jgi:hypothetical protein